MLLVEIKQQLHQYIETADEKSIEAIYTILKGSIQQSRFSPEDLKKFYGRRTEYMTGNMRGYSVEEAHSIIRRNKTEHYDN